MAPKVLFTASTFSHILNFHLPYLRAFQEQGWTVHAACGGTYADIPYTDETLELPFEKSMGSPRNFRAASILREKIRQERYDLISTHTSLAAFFTRLALQGMAHRPPLANMVHGYLFDDDTPALRRQILLMAERWTAPQTDLILTMARWDFDAANRYGLGRRVVHIPGVGVDFSRHSIAEGIPDIRAAHGIADGAAVLLYPAEFSKRKSQEVLIRAMERLPANVVLILVGDGVLRESCRKLAAELGLEDRVLFPGYIRDMNPWYRASDIAVASSRIEGLPFNIMEAMYCGVPVVASRVKGHADLIADGETGLLYPYGDAAVCAAQIQRLLESEDLRRRLTARASEQVQKYDLDRVFPLVMEQYQSLVYKEVAV